jgi:hypothetical protein
VAATLDSVPLLVDLVTGAGLGALIGNWIAYRQERRGLRVNREWVVTRWSVWGAVAGPVVDAALGLP